MIAAETKGPKKDRLTSRRGKKIRRDHNLVKGELSVNRKGLKMNRKGLNINRKGVSVNRDFRCICFCRWSVVRACSRS